jgi:DMSO/TMAO reductase YedYZ molybdopterin-dependent catalytic subunit
MIINTGFSRRRERNDRLPPGQYETRDFPVLSFGPTPHIDRAQWKLEVAGLVKHPTTWTWDEFARLPHQDIHADIHCVTRWSKFDTNWTGVSLDDIIRLVEVEDDATHLIAHSYEGYSTNLPIADITNKQAFVATAYEDDDIPPAHGGPARLFVPHLYFWKSAKWLKALEFVDHDEPGFWEVRGYHNYGDPWREQRYSNDQ